MSRDARIGPDPLTTFWIDRNPASGSRLPYLLRLPVAGEGPIADGRAAG